MDKLCKVYSVRDFETALDDLRQGNVSRSLPLQIFVRFLLTIDLVGGEAHHPLGLMGD